MSRTGTSTRPDALSNFKALEERVGRLLDALGQARLDTHDSSERLREARTRIQELESEIRDLRKDRKTIRARVEDMIRDISALERDGVENRGKRVG